MKTCLALAHLLASFAWEMNFAIVNCIWPLPLLTNLCKWGKIEWKIMNWLITLFLKPVFWCFKGLKILRIKERVYVKKKNTNFDLWSSPGSWNPSKHWYCWNISVSEASKLYSGSTWVQLYNLLPQLNPLVLKEEDNQIHRRSSSKVLAVSGPQWCIAQSTGSPWIRPCAAHSIKANQGS